jgi:hypothetical protein
MAFFPEGRCDRSLARTAWDTAPDHTVPYGTVLSGDAFPGTSCLAKISLSLRDKAILPSKRLRIISAPMEFTLALKRHMNVRSMNDTRSSGLEMLKGRETIG